MNNYQKKIMLKPLFKTMFTKNELKKISNLSERQITNLRQKKILNDIRLHFEYTDLIKACLYKYLSVLTSAVKAYQIITNYRFYTLCYEKGTDYKTVLKTSDLILIDYNTNQALIAKLKNEFFIKKELTTSFDTEVIAFISEDPIDFIQNNVHVKSKKWIMINIYKLRKEIEKRVRELNINEEKLKA